MPHLFGEPGDQALASLFLENNANLEYPGRYPDPLRKGGKVVEGITPLMIATKGGYKEIVLKLLEAGAKKEARDSLGRTALDYAAASPNTALRSVLELK